MTHICVGKLTTFGSDNGLSPGRRQTIIWTNAGILLIGLLGTNFSEILIEIQTFSFQKVHFKMSSAKWRPFCLGFNVLKGLSERSNTRRSLTPVFSIQDYGDPLGILFNSSHPGQNDRHLVDDLFKCIFVNEKFCISFQISLKFVPMDSIDNNPALA